LIIRQLTLAAAALAFCVVAILNCGGYRYGIGDQAFYVPAVVQHLDASLFPRDRVLLHAQDRFMLYDDGLALVSQAAGITIPVLFFMAYVAGTIVLFGAAVAIGRSMYRSWWTVAALAALLTLRHRITQTGANSLEAYFQPRMFAFALGACAVAAYLRGRGAAALALVAAAFVLHPTTAVWFGVWIAAALAVADRRWRKPAAILCGVAAVAAVWAVTLGPLRGHLARMDAQWASALAGKDYIFPSHWNASFWLVNMSYLLVAAAIYAMRRRRGAANPREPGLLAGAAALVVLFLAACPLMVTGVALALQLQISRVFWMLDFLAAVYLAWLLAESPSSGAVRKAVAAVLVAAAVGRGLFVWRAEHAGSELVRVQLPEDSWHDAMKWISKTPPASYVLADPGHAWKYGTSVRVAGERDVYLEEVKDLALALYSREVAVESLRRIHDAQNFDALTAGDLRTLAGRYHLDYAVLDRDVRLPLVYRNERFRIYDLRQSATHAP
jgi:hypothetical protein